MSNPSTIQAPSESLANKAVYYWDLYTLHGHVDDLAAANAFRLDYARLGGSSHPNVMASIASAVATLK